MTENPFKLVPAVREGFEAAEEALEPEKDFHAFGLKKGTELDFHACEAAAVAFLFLRVKLTGAAAAAAAEGVLPAELPLRPDPVAVLAEGKQLPEYELALPEGWEPYRYVITMRRPKQMERIVEVDVELRHKKAARMFNLFPAIGKQAGEICERLEKAAVEGGLRRRLIFVFRPKDVVADFEAGVLMVGAAARACAACCASA
mgnify:FL=1